MNRQAWYLPKHPDDIRPIPWLHPAAIGFLLDVLKPGFGESAQRFGRAQPCPSARALRRTPNGMAVLEHGGGGSTLWLAERATSVVTYEHNAGWAQKLLELVPANVTIIQEHLPPASGQFDLLFIDGERSARGAFLTAAPDLLSAGGWVVLDNANRPEYDAERFTLLHHFRMHARFDNNLPFSKYFVTEFWQKCETVSIPT